MADQTDDRANYKVGFKRPPPWGQIQKGERRNPKGRPKGTGKKQMASRQAARLTEFEQLLSDLLGEEVTLTLGGRKLSVTKKRAVILNLFKQAMSGQPVAMREINRAIEKLEAKEEARARAEAEAVEQATKAKAEKDEATFRFLVDLRKTQARLWERAVVEGKLEPEQPWPHPDDILLDHASRTGRVRGPLDAASVPRWKDVMRLRDHFLARHVLAIRTEGEARGLVPMIWTAALFREDLNLPLRWQVTHDLWACSRQLHAMSIRKLEAIVADGAAEFEDRCSLARRSKEHYQHQNRMFGPMLRVLGYRSLRQFERACEDFAGSASRAGLARSNTLAGLS